MMRFKNQGFDHVEFAVQEITPHARVYERMGFEKIGERRDLEQGTRTAAYAQGWIRILLTQPDSTHASGEAMSFLKKHGEGICTLGVEVESARQFFEETTRRGARPAAEPRTARSEEGQLMRAEIWTPGDLRYAFMERQGPAQAQKPALLDAGLTVSRLESPSPIGLRVIDHLTNNVTMGQMQPWVDWYQKTFDFVTTRHFHIRTGRTGLRSQVIESQDGKIKVPVNEATEPESQVEEFVTRMKGAGVQHLALFCADLSQTLRVLRAQGFKFLTVPSTYYEMVPTRVSGVTEDLKELEALGILLDGDETGYLLQIFTEEVVGPFFFEFIQRKGNRGFGEGNFKALFEAIERDQIRRGVLKA